MRKLHTIAAVAAGAAALAATGYQMLRDTRLPLAPRAAILAPPPASATAPAEAFAALPVLPAPDALARHLHAPDTLAVSAACAPAALTIAPAPMAMLSVALSAPCQPGSRVEVQHDGLAFAVLTDAGGSFSGEMPALARQARVQVILADGMRLAAWARVNDVDSVERVVLLVGASSALHLNAFENGAGFGDPGHLSAARPGAPGAGPGGFFTPLGDGAAIPPLRAEVYTAPAGRAPAQFAVQADVTAATCGTDLGASVLRSGTPSPLAFTLAMPPCDGIDGGVLLPLPEPPLALALADQR